MSDPVEEAVGLAEHYLDLGYYERAREQCLTVLRVDPGHVDARFVLGVVEFGAGDYVAARDLLGGVAGEHPDWAPGLRWYAQACLWSDDRPTARSAAQEALRLEPDDVDNLLTLAEIIRFDDVVAASTLVDQAAAVDPEHGDLTRVRALVLRRRHRYGAARAEVRSTVAADATNWRSLYLLATMEGRGLRFARSIRAVFAAAAEYPQSGAQAIGTLSFVLTRLVFTVQVALFVIAVGVIASTDQVLSSPSVPDRESVVSVAPLSAPGSVGRSPTIDTEQLTRALEAAGNADRLDGRRTVVDRILPLWARIVAGVLLTGVALLVVRSLAAVPGTGWRPVRESMRGGWATARIFVCIGAFITLVVAVIGPPIAASYALLPLLLGLFSAGKSLWSHR